MPDASPGRRELSGSVDVGGELALGDDDTVTLPPVDAEGGGDETVAGVFRNAIWLARSGPWPGGPTMTRETEFGAGGRYPWPAKIPHRRCRSTSPMTHAKVLEARVFSNAEALTLSADCLPSPHDQTPAVPPALQPGVSTGTLPPWIIDDGPRRPARRSSNRSATRRRCPVRGHRGRWRDPVIGDLAWTPKNLA